MRRKRLLNLLGAAAVAVSDRVDDRMRKAAGLEAGAAAAVLTIGTRPGRPIKDLGRTVGLSHSGTVRLVDRLEDRGWVARDASGEGREVRLELTGPGRRKFQELLAARRAALEDVTSPLTKEERACLGDALEALLSPLPSDRDDAWRICRLCEHRVCRGAGCPVGTAVEG